jgi:hypothetical protein
MMNSWRENEAQVAAPPRFRHAPGSGVLFLSISSCLRNCFQTGKIKLGWEFQERVTRGRGQMSLASDREQQIY